MSTRGLYGFRINDRDYFFYSHYDSYPTGLGQEFMEFIRSNIDKRDELMKAFPSMEEDPAMAEILQNYDSVSEYINTMIKHNKMHTNNNFMLNSLFCEYAYVWNMDENSFEFYEGFNEGKGINGRYATIEDPCNEDRSASSPKYYGCNLLVSCSVELLDELNELDTYLSDYDPEDI